jgi:glycosyltransferase involved in cell wall biosynthesis
MKILLASPSMHMGGAERVVAMLTAGLVERGHEVAIVAPPGERDEDLREVRHQRLPLQDYGRTASGAVRSAMQMSSAIREVGPDVIHAQNVKHAAIGRIAATVAAPRARRPVLATFHGVLASEYRRAALVLALADHVACVSGAVLERIVACGLPRERASLIRNAVEMPAPLDPDRRAMLDGELGLGESPVVATVGRLVPQKAHERFIAAARIVAQSRPDVRFLIVGEGPRQADLERIVREAGIERQLTFTGRRSDAREIIARAQVLVFSSEWEGLSIAALEALAAGTPVVSTDVEGMRELLAGGAGAIVALDDGTALGERLLALLDDDAERLAMGRLARELVAREFSLSVMIDAYIALYERLARA